MSSDSLVTEVSEVSVVQIPQEELDAVFGRDAVDEEIVEEVVEEAKEEAKEEEAKEEEAKEEDSKDKSPKLKAILKREAKIVEARKEIDNSKKEIETMKQEIESKKAELAKFDLPEIAKLHKLALGLKANDVEAKRELWNYVGMSPKDFLEASFKANPKFVRDTFKDILDKDGKEFRPEDKEKEDEISKLKREKEDRDRAELQRKSQEAVVKQRDTVAGMVVFTEDTPILQSLPREELGDILVQTIQAVVKKNPALREESLSVLIPKLLPKIEQHYEKMYEPALKALEAKRAKKGQAESNDSKSEVASSKSTQDPKKSKTLKKSTGKGNSQSTDEAVMQVPVRDRAKALAEAGLLKGII